MLTGNVSEIFHMYQLEYIFIRFYKDDAYLKDWLMHDNHLFPGGFENFVVNNVMNKLACKTVYHRGHNGYFRSKSSNILYNLYKYHYDAFKECCLMEVDTLSEIIDSNFEVLMNLNNHPVYLELINHYLTDEGKPKPIDMIPLIISIHDSMHNIECLTELREYKYDDYDLEHEYTFDPENNDLHKMMI